VNQSTVDPSFTYRDFQQLIRFMFPLNFHFGDLSLDHLLYRGGLSKRGNSTRYDIVDRQGRVILSQVDAQGVSFWLHIPGPVRLSPAEYKAHRSSISYGSDGVLRWMTLCTRTGGTLLTPCQVIDEHDKVIVPSQRAPKVKKT